MPRALIFLLAGLALGLVYRVVRMVRNRRRPEARVGLAGVEPGYDLEGAGYPARLVEAMVRTFSGGAHLMLEGFDLVGRIPGDLPVSDNPPEPLNSHTIWAWPVPSRTVVVTIEPATLDAVISSVVPLVELVDVEHVQIARNGRLEFGAYDQFDFCWVSDRVPEALLAELKSQGVLAEYHATPGSE